MSISNNKTNLDIRLEIFKLARDKNKTRNLAIELIEKYSYNNSYLIGGVHAFYNIKDEQFTTTKIFGETILATPLPISSWVAEDRYIDKLIKLKNVDKLHDYVHEQLHVLMDYYKDDLLKIYFRDDVKPRSHLLETFGKLEIGDDYEVRGYIFPEWISTYKIKDVLNRYLILKNNLVSTDKHWINGYIHSYDKSYHIISKTTRFKIFKNNCYEYVKNQILNSTFQVSDVENKWGISLKPMRSLLYEIAQEIGSDKVIKVLNDCLSEYILEDIINEFKLLDKSLSISNS